MPLFFRLELRVPVDDERDWRRVRTLRRRVDEEAHVGRHVVKMAWAARVRLEQLARSADGSPTPAKTGSTASPEPMGVYSAASTGNVSDAYNALKTYIMLGERSRVETGHLGDQLTRFWRGWLEANRGTMPREQLIRSAERMLSFVLAQTNDPAFPQLKNNLTLVDGTRENLRRVVRGMPARERVYGEIKARAATRFAPMTVLRIVGERHIHAAERAHMLLELAQMRASTAVPARGDRQQRGQPASVLFEQLDAEQFLAAAEPSRSRKRRTTHWAHYSPRDSDSGGRRAATVGLANLFCPAADDEAGGRSAY